MPWSFVSYIEKIMNTCKKAGFENEISVNRLRTEIMRETGVTNSKKLGEYLHVMVELGYLKKLNDNVVEFSISYGLPYTFKSDEKIEVVGPVVDPKLDEEMKDIKEAKVLKEK
jgi:hypothetical protein